AAAGWTARGRLPGRAEPGGARPERGDGAAGHAGAGWRRGAVRERLARHLRGSNVSATQNLASRPREVLAGGGRRRAARARGGEGSAVVVLHGWGASVDAVASIQDGLSDEFRVVSLDLPGFGQSELPPSGWGSPEYADLVAEALGRLGLGRVDLIGHSFGGKL